MANHPGLTDLDGLVASPFARLADLLQGIEPGAPPIDLSLGEPRALIPAFLGPTLGRHLDEFGRYPPIRGIPALREAITAWLGRRYPLLARRIDPTTHVLPLNGSREGLFSAIFPALARKPSATRPAVLIPNPFYQAYAAAAAAAGAEPVFLLLGGDEFPAKSRRHRRRAADAHRRFLSLFAVEPARRRGEPPLSRGRGGLGPALRLHAVRRRMLFRDL